MGIWIGLGVFAAILYIVMTAMMIIFERDKPKNIILWSSIFLVTQIVGYLIYYGSRIVFVKKKKALKRKLEEDDIYHKLIANNLTGVAMETHDEQYKFNTLAYGARLTEHNAYEMITDLVEFKDELETATRSAKNIIILEFPHFNFVYFEEFKNLLIKKSKEGVQIRLVSENKISRKLKKELNENGIKFHRFSKYITMGRVYANHRGVVNIDNKVCYLGNFDIQQKHLAEKADVVHTFLKLTGEVAQDVGVASLEDAVFASGKFINYQGVEPPANKHVVMQYVVNEANTDIELLLINAIRLAKKSIQLQLNEFIPTESIISLLRFALNSGIEIRLMIPLKVDRHGKYFASRAYAKELALYGATVYLYDGYIRFNAITIDDVQVLTGSYQINRGHISSSLQNVLIVEDRAFADKFTKIFDDCINNSYRINNAKNMLLRERFFKNFV